MTSHSNISVQHEANNGSRRSDSRRTSSRCLWLFVSVLVAFFFFPQKASVVEDPQVSRNYLVLQHRSSRNIDAVAMVGDDDDSSLEEENYFSVHKLILKKIIAVKTMKLFR